MDFQKFVNNAFFAVVTGLGSYAVTRLDKITDDLDSVKKLSYETRGEQRVQDQITKHLTQIAETLEKRMRFLEKRGPG